MADSKISALTTLAASDLASDDLFPVVDTSATTSKAMTRTAIIDALKLNGVVTFVVGEPGDGTLANSQAVAYLDTAVSPIVIKVKAKDGSGNVFTGVLT